MTIDPGMHTPTPEFRAALEAEVRSALRREERFAPAPRPWRHDRLRTVALLVAGLVLGIGTQFATAQVRESQDRSALESALMVDRNVAGLRVEVARADHERARRGFDVGTVSRQSLLQAATQARAAELAFARFELDLAEVRVTASAPRNELWAPLVGGRDFVRERLMLSAALAQQRLAGADTAAMDVERLLSIGVGTRHGLDDAKLEAADAKREFQVAAQRMMLRDQFLKEALTPEEVARRAQRFEATADAARVQALLQLATARIAALRQRVTAGTADELEVKRAEVELLERTIELERIMARLRAAGPPQP
jgi:hypothetical protein